jgi:MerR family transcriptional regulator, light-induced transcriptional regulator
MSLSSETPTYNLKAVIQETRLKPDTLRAWERRYGLPQPYRTPGGHRLYSQHDIDMLKWLVARQEEGLSISRAVDLWHSLNQDGQDPLQTNTPPPPLSLAAPSPLATGSAINEVRRAWVAACLAFDERTAENILAQAAALYPLETVCFELLQKGLNQIGEAWYQGEVTVQQEHFASALAMRRLDALVAATPPPTRPGRILVGCPPAEEHTFSALLITLLLRRHGWDILYLGANVPPTRLEFTLATTRPQLVILPAQQLATAASLLEMAHLLDQERVPLAYGGAVFNHIPALRSRIPGHFLGERLDMTPQMVEQFLLLPRLGWPPPAVILPSEEYQQALSYYREHQALIEAQVWELMKGEPIRPSQLATANIEFARNIVAALILGDIEFMGASVAWVEGLFVNHKLPEAQLWRYLTAYRQAVQTQLDERGQIIRAWLAGLVWEDTQNE